MKRGYGWKKDKHDPRDHYFAAAHTITALPPVMDWRQAAPPVCYDQLDSNSCVGHSIAGDIHYDIRRQGLDEWMPSPLFIYSNARRLEDGLADDSGCEIRDGIKGVVEWGACFNDDWPLEMDKLSVMPALRCYADAKTHLIGRYARVGQTLSALKTCLAGGNLVVFGFNVYREFDSDEVAETGRLPMPTRGSTPEGGHAVLAVGYNDHTQQFLIRNSWGPHWGVNGHFFMDYQYALNPSLAADFWTIQSMQV